MAEDIAKAAAEVGNKAVMDLSLTAGAFSLSLKIDNVWLAGAVSVGALSLGAFYLACKGPSESAIRRALERKFLGVVDPKVTNIEDGHSILTELLCSTETSFLVFLEDFKTKRIKFRLEEEFKKIGFSTELDVTLRNAEKVYQQVIQIRNRELDNIKESLKREMAISKGLRGTIGKLQEENRRLGESTQQGKVDGIEIKDKTRAGKEEMKILQRDIRELREKVHELEKENEMLQQKLKKKDRELERFQALETDIDIQQPRPRASSGTSLGLSSGYQSEEDPEENSLEIIQMPRSQAIQEGRKLVLSCRTRSLPDVSYRWIKDDIEIPGANRSDLVLEPVRMHDFGRYFCRVWDKSGSLTSEPADVDVFPSPHMRFRGLHELDADAKQAVIDLLSKKSLPRLPTWKQIARRYAMRETEISSLEKEKIPARAMLEKLTSLAPNLTVYYVCKTFKEAGLRRLDLVEVLSQRMAIAVH
ncbi:carbohydrate binding [Porites harrisoni]